VFENFIIISVIPTRRRYSIFISFEKQLACEKLRTVNFTGKKKTEITQ